MAIFLRSLGRFLLVVRNTLILLLPAFSYALESGVSTSDPRIQDSSAMKQTSCSHQGGGCTPTYNYDPSIHTSVYVFDVESDTNPGNYVQYHDYCRSLSQNGPWPLFGYNRSGDRCFYGDPPDVCPFDSDPIREYGCQGGLVVGTEGNYPICSSSIPPTVCNSGCLFTGPSHVIGTPDSPYPGTNYYPDSTWIYQPAGSECNDSPQDGDKFIPDGFESDGSDNLDGFDGDGDGTPDEDDLDPSDPLIGGDTDGDGTADHEDPDPNDPAVGGSTDPGGFGDGSGGEFGSGMCTPNTRSEPTCKPHMDVINCGIFLEQWNTRCDSKLFHAEIIGTDQYRSGNDLDDAEGEGVPEASFNAGSVISGLSETTISWGGGSCPNDRSFEMPGAFGGTFSLSYQPICDFAVMVRPVVIALGYMISALIILRKFSGSGSDD
ncbi:MAG: virulence factor TspB C-terminal domain-related protein [Alloalcanivorax sp.]